MDSRERVSKLFEGRKKESYQSSAGKVRELLAVNMVAISLLCGTLGMASDNLEKNFVNPPRESQSWCYWWWLNGAASKEGITRDFEEMRKQGIGGTLLVDAGDAPTDQVPRGPAFMSEPWRELFRHAVREANRCGIVLTVALCSGWNAGGPWVTAEHAAKRLVSNTTLVQGPGPVTIKTPTMSGDRNYRDIVVLAQPVLEEPQKPE